MRLASLHTIQWKRRLTQICLGLFLLMLPVKAQHMNVNNTDRIAIRSVIEQQLQALQQDDAKTAFSFANSEIREKFGTPENFLKMVKIAYPAVYLPRSVLFEGLGLVEGVLTQQVLLMSPKGDLVRAHYLMERQPNGTWKISGCFLVPVQAEGEII